MNDHTFPLRAYFITLCAYQSQPLLGRLVDGRVKLTEAGRIAELCWLSISHSSNPGRNHAERSSAKPDNAQFTEYVRADAYIVMPNHFHGILTLGLGTDQFLESMQSFASISDHTLPSTINHPGSEFRNPDSTIRNLIPVLRSFKAAATNRVNHLQNTPGVSLWQPSYHARPIKTMRALESFRVYIENNPAAWSDDPLNPDGSRPAPFCPVPFDLDD